MVLNGNSGCELKLINSGVIRKTSITTEYNIRLDNQIRLQSEFTHHTMKTPKILDSGLIDGKRYYDMEFINGQKLSDYLNNSKFEDTVRLFNRVLSFINENDEGEVYTPTYYTLAKLEEIEKKISIDVSISNFVKKNVGGYVPIGKSHGDLTFENIIVFNDELYLIDFLDGYIQTPIIDISKLYQELHLNWSNRSKETAFLTNVRNHELKKLLDNFIKEKQYDTKSVKVQIVMTLLRILPYTKNTEIYYKVLNKIFQIINL